MLHQDHYIPICESVFHYRQWGTGREWLFCFHGYGEDAASFGFLAAELGERFTLIAIDMPFHGQTAWNEGLLLQPGQLVSLINQVKPADQPMRILGYSMGGRIALHLLGLIPGQISGMVLVAPDGLHNNPWQRIATTTRAGNRLFRLLMRCPAPMLLPLQLFAKLGLFNRRLLRFIRYYLDEAGQRKKLYQRWTTLRRFNADTKKLARTIRENRIPVSLVFGHYDTVILAKHGYRFSKLTGDQVKVTVLEAGHQLLKEKHAALISKLLVQ